ncbi:MAG: hypothetical protein ACM3JJ_12400 [Hyphomicrobiales bacterium]
MLAAVAALAIAGCSADGIHTTQKFFPGSQLTAWNACDKFAGGGNQIAICAAKGLLTDGVTQGYTIQFTLPEPVHVRIAVFDDRARLLKVLLDSDESATLQGQFRTPPVVWDFTDANGVRVKDGDYRLYFKADTYLSTSDVTVP